MTIAFHFNFGAINWLAVFVAGIATFMIGGAWYTALFGKLWQKLHAYTPEEMEAMRKRRPPPVFFGTMIVCYIAVALAMAVIVTSFDVRGATDGAILGFLMWLGIVTPVAYTGHIASDRHDGIFLIDALYQIIYLTMTGAIIAGWR